MGTADGDLRVLVLRAFHGENWQFRFHTDSRSPKVGMIEAQPSIGLLFYDKDVKVQIRVRGTATVHRDDALADAAWAESTNFARRCYLAVDGPGSASPRPTSGLPPHIEGEQPSDDDLRPARSNFAIIMVRALRLDWLYLANSGHRRAVFERGETDGTDWQGRWVIP
jgi:hypothetical protein